MKTYELLAIIKPIMDTEEVDKVIEKIEETVKGYNGSVISTDKIGRKRLAFEVANFKDGFFVTEKVELPADKVAEFKKQLKLNDNIIRTMFVEASKVSA